MEELWSSVKRRGAVRSSVDQRGVPWSDVEELSIHFEAYN